jgi:hypothetical protein
MTKNQKIKIFLQIEQECKDGSLPQRVNEFIENDSINAISISVNQYGLFYYMNKGSSALHVVGFYYVVFSSYY